MNFIIIIHIMISMMLIKTLHIFFMTAWFAGLFYLPRLFVYHSMADDKISLDRFIVMEKKLLYGIMTPSGILTIFFGLLLTYFYYPIYLEQTWLALKMLLVAVLVFYHIWYRWFNEFPVVILISIIALAIYKP